MGKFSGMMIASDIDGTILPYKGKISDRNIKAIRYFEENGGVFTLVTGRSIAAAKYIAEEIGICVPMVVDNGSLIYDSKTDEILSKTDLPAAASDILISVLKKFPQASAQTYRDKDFFIHNLNVHILNHVTDVERTSLDESLVISAEESPTPWQKVLVACDEDVASQVYEYAITLPHEGINIVRSSKHYVELVPKNSTKGEGTLKLAQMLGIDRENLFTAGDYLNDRELIAVGGKSFAPDDAHEEIKANADFVVGPCHDGVIADIIDYIEKVNF